MQTSTESVLLGDQDLHFFNEGSHVRLYDRLGAHVTSVNGEIGTYFAVWAPNAERVNVMGEFNGWNKESHSLYSRAQSGIWERFFSELRQGATYKYYIVSRDHDYCVDKMDPFAFFNEVPPKTASIVWDLTYAWGDQTWMMQRHKRNALDAPIAIYEVHLGSWRRVPKERNRSLGYRELARLLPAYLQKMGFTHVEFLPVMEHPFYGS